MGDREERHVDEYALDQTLSEYSGLLAVDLMIHLGS
jgi:hypothetical protein